MADPTNQHLYRVGPGTGKWISYSELLLLLAHWNLEAPGAGVPSLTISKDTREAAPAAVVALEICGSAHGLRVCHEEPDHGNVHTDGYEHWSTLD